MALLTFTAGTQLPAASMNSLAKQVVITCTSGSRPGSPNAGMTIYETDTNRVLCWNGSAWLPPQNLPWGHIGTGAASGSQSGIGGTVVDVTSLSVTWTAVAGRRYRTTATIPIFSLTGGPGTVQLQITDAANAIKNAANATIMSSSDGSLFVSFVETPSAGSTTRKARILATGGTGTITGSTSCVPALTVEDIGT